MAEISVIIPVYNVEMYLERCVQSVLNNTYSDFEIILVNDGSTDASGSICDDLVKRDERIFVIHKENNGVSSARNVGIDYVMQNSNSKWITFIDSDDWVHREYLEKLLEAILIHKTEISVCKFIRTDKYKKDVELLGGKAYICTAEECWVKYRKAEAYPWGKLYKKECFMDIRYPIGRIYEDSFTTYKLLFACDEIALIDEDLYYYYVNNDSITLKKWSEKKLDAVYAHEEQLDFFKKNNYKESYKLTNMIYMDCVAQSVDMLSKDEAYQQNYIKLKKKFRKLIKKNIKTIYTSKKLKQYCKIAYPKGHTIIKLIFKKRNNIYEIYCNQGIKGIIKKLMRNKI